MKKRANGEGTKVLPHASGRYYAQVSVDGKRITVSGSTKTEVIAKRTDLLANVNRGLLASPDRITLSEWLTRWLDVKRPHVSPHTSELYTNTLRLYIPEKLGKLKLQSIKRSYLKALETELAGRGCRSASALKSSSTFGPPSRKPSNRNSSP